MSIINGSSCIFVKFMIFSNCNFFYKCFVDIYSIDRISCFISRKDYNIFYFMFDSRKKNVFSIENISVSSFYREKFIIWYLFESGGGKNVVNIMYSNIYRSFVVDIIDIEFYFRIL